TSKSSVRGDEGGPKQERTQQVDDGPTDEIEHVACPSGLSASFGEVRFADQSTRLRTFVMGTPRRSSGWDGPRSCFRLCVALSEGGFSSIGHLDPLRIR